MTIGPAEIDRWDPEAVLDVGRAATARAEAAAAASAALAGLPAFTTWAGVAADAARQAISGIRAELDAQADTARTAARETTRAAGAIRRLKAELRGLRDRARSAGCGAEDPPFADRLAEILAEADVVDCQLAQAFCLVDGRGPAPRTPTTVPTFATPQEVKRWWDGLRPDERAEILARDPDRLGNLDGIPVADRDRANRAALNRDLDRTADAVRHANALATRRALEEKAVQTGCPTYLLTYQPEAFLGQGRVAMAINNPDQARKTAVVVPGTQHSVTTGWLAGDEAAGLLAELTDAMAGEPPPAVVAWMGYDAPDSPVDPRIGMTGLAQEGGALLAGDVNALSVTNAGRSHVTVIGHSYGATTVADAAAGYRMRADDVVLIGCPGTDLAHDAADFGLPEGGHVYVGSASTDPVTQFGRVPQMHIGESGVAVALGPDPAADGYGSTRFKAETAGVTIGDHDGYYVPGSESLFSIADIASGNGAALAGHGMTAPHRDSALSDFVAAFSPVAGAVLDDPELLRPGTGGHHHRTAP